MNTPEITIVIPVYNVARYLPRALDSALAQTWSDYEIVCVDDGSTDGCADILAQYAAKSSRIRTVRQENAGLAAARNTGIRAARGKWLYFMDSDDYIHPQLLECTIHFARKYTAELVYFNMKTTTRDDEPMPAISPEQIRHVVTERPILLSPPHRGSMCVKLFARHLFDEVMFDPDMRFGEDLHLSYRLLARPLRTVVLDAVFYYYRIGREGSLTSASMVNMRRVECELKNLRMLIELYDRPGLEQERDVLAGVFPIKIIIEDIHRAYRRASGEPRKQIAHKLAEIIRELKRHGMFPRRGYKLSRYLKYHWLLLWH